MKIYFITCSDHSETPMREYKWENACATFNRAVLSGCTGVHSLWSEASFSDQAHKLDPRKIPELISR